MGERESTVEAVELTSPPTSGNTVGGANTVGGTVREHSTVPADFWHGKRVFLTGHTGFKGSWLALWLQAMHAQVAGYALPAPTTPSLFELAQVASGMAHTIGDVCDLPTLHTAMAAHRSEIVFHLAAQPLVRRSYQEPVETYATNVMGTVHLLDCVRRVPSVRAVVVVTTDKCYDNREWPWPYRENEAMGGFDPYSSSKGCAELVTAAYRSSFFREGAVAVASARAGNVIGGGDWAPDRLIPDAMAAFAAGRTLTLRNPGATRPWQHVLEPLGGYLILAQALWEHGQDYAEAWNFGPHAEDAWPVAQVIDTLATLWGGTARWEVDKAMHPHEAHCLQLDIAKARARLRWQPRLRLQQALEHTVDWYRRLHAGEDARELTLQQLQRYRSEDPTHGSHSGHR
ncbi:CDP-glucose 4,6-dehydratase [Candidatus Symbiobacter mobilis]|uniref:CDP-glucose 4,6-dehydratase n=1 Tax=Candidatus Symbiobacter mobilis CR TaxID=946483 RepID=U5N9B0_9BURK|nr:CDP-glucose 4,6-dehydratase [Candidatus Symbiobacter mobilis]AGX87885.1 CDP-glucose 4,6-dehydratase [Candidatus Symbiobacter mobilis CR]